jgi:hypothetical protein
MCRHNLVGGGGPELFEQATLSGFGVSSDQDLLWFKYQEIPHHGWLTCRGYGQSRATLARDQGSVAAIKCVQYLGYPGDVDHPDTACDCIRLLRPEREGGSVGGEHDGRSIPRPPAAISQMTPLREMNAATGYLSRLEKVRHYRCDIGQFRAGKGVSTGRPVGARQGIRMISSLEWPHE